MAVVFLSPAAALGAFSRSLQTTRSTVFFFQDGLVFFTRFASTRFAIPFAFFFGCVRFFLGATRAPARIRMTHAHKKFILHVG